METNQKIIKDLNIIPKIIASNVQYNLYKETGESSIEKWKSFFDDWQTLNDKAVDCKRLCISKTTIDGYLLKSNLLDKKVNRQKLVSAEVSCAIDGLPDHSLYFNIFLYLKLTYEDMSVTSFVLAKRINPYENIPKIIFDAENLTITSEENEVQIEKAATFAEIVKFCEDTLTLLDEKSLVTNIKQKRK